MTPRSWENWKAHYEQQGYRVLTPAYPGFEVEVEALNADMWPRRWCCRLKSTFPVPREIGRRKAAGFTFEQWRYAFTNTFTEEESRALTSRPRCGCCGAVRWLCGRPARARRTRQGCGFCWPLWRKVGLVASSRLQN